MSDKSWISCEGGWGSSLVFFLPFAPVYSTASSLFSSSVGLSVVFLAYF